MITKDQTMTMQRAHEALIEVRAAAVSLRRAKRVLRKHPFFSEEYKTVAGHEASLEAVDSLLRRTFVSLRDKAAES